jgi:hypothetical protein
VRGHQVLAAVVVGVMAAVRARNSCRAMYRSNGVSPQSDEPWHGRLPLPGQAHAGTRGQSDRRHSLRLDMSTMTRSAYVQVSMLSSRCGASAFHATPNKSDPRAST